MSTRATRRAIAVATLSFLALAASACTPLRLPPARTDRASAATAAAEPRLRSREEKDAATGRVVRAWTELVLPDGAIEKHGLERAWFRDGTPRSEREYEHGRGTGSWRTWYPSGALRSEYQYGVDGELTAMRHYHPDGAPSAEGPAIGGLKTGEWTYWHANGVVASRGPYVDGRREGTWSFFDEQGELVARGTMRRDKRVGAWELRGRSTPAQ